jgi:hypothetical protein
VRCKLDERSVRLQFNVGNGDVKLGTRWRFRTMGLAEEPAIVKRLYLDLLC